MRKFAAIILALSFYTAIIPSQAPVEKLKVGPVELICVTPDAERTSAYIALTSVMPNDSVEEVRHTRVLSGHISARHWSALEHGYMTVKIYTTRAISLQLIRHRSFTFQQFSQKYADTAKIIPGEIALPDLRLRNSRGNFPEEKKAEFEKRIKQLFATSLDLYKEMVAYGIKTECARFVLPEATPTTVCMTGSIRSWIHFIEKCSEMDSQDEMREIVAACREIFKQMFPNIFSYLKSSRQQFNWK